MVRIAELQLQYEELGKLMRPTLGKVVDLPGELIQLSKVLKGKIGTRDETPTSSEGRNVPVAVTPLKSAALFRK